MRRKLHRSLWMRFMGKTNDTTTERWSEETEVETEIETVVEGKRNKKRVQIENADAEINKAFLHWCTHKVYRDLKFTFLPAVSLKDKIKLLELHAPDNVLRELRQYFPPKFLRHARTKRKQPFQAGSAPTKDNKNKSTREGYYRFI